MAEIVITVQPSGLEKRFEAPEGGAPCDVLADLLKRLFGLGSLHHAGTITELPPLATVHLQAGSYDYRTFADQTARWLRNLPEIGSVPRFEELYEVFTSTVTAGSRVKLPICDRRYALLTMQSAEWYDWVEPVSKSAAYDMAQMVEGAVTMIVEEPDSEMIIPVYVDRLFYDVMQLISRSGTRASRSVRRQWNVTEPSMSKLHPDFMLLVQDALLFKGEDRAHSEDLRAAKTGLLKKMADWSAAYPSTLEYMLCYAAAGSRLQFCAMKPYVPGQLPDMMDVMSELDLSSPFHRLCVIHTALLTYSIITKQHAQLPRDHKPLGIQVQRGLGCTISYFSGCIVKCVKLDQNPLLQDIADKMSKIYAATCSCEFIIDGHNVCVTQDHYRVQLSPVATAMSVAPWSERELAAAVRCILYALQCLHSNGWGHGDLCWRNVVVEQPGKYQVIDLESAVPLNSKPQLEVRPRAWGEEAQALENGVFTAQSDLYMVGNMMQEALGCYGGDTLATKLVRKQLTLDEALQDDWIVQAVGPC